MSTQIHKQVKIYWTRLRITGLGLIQESQALILAKLKLFWRWNEWNLNKNELWICSAKSIPDLLLDSSTFTNNVNKQYSEYFGEMAKEYCILWPSPLSEKLACDLY